MESILELVDASLARNGFVFLTTQPQSGERMQPRARPELPKRAQAVGGLAIQASPEGAEQTKETLPRRGNCQ